MGADELLLGFYEPGEVMTVCHHPEAAELLNDTYTHERAHEDLTVSTTTGHYQLALSLIERAVRRLGSRRTITDAEIDVLRECRIALADATEMTQEGFATWRELLSIGDRHGAQRVSEVYYRLPGEYQLRAKIFFAIAAELPPCEGPMPLVGDLMYALAAAAMNTHIFDVLPDFHPDLPRRLDHDLTPDRRLGALYQTLVAGAAEVIGEHFEEYVADVARLEESAAFEQQVRAAQRRFLNAVHGSLALHGFDVDTSIADLDVINVRIDRLLRSACRHFAIRDAERVLNAHAAAETTHLDYARHRMTFEDVPRERSPRVRNAEDLLTWAKSQPKNDAWRIAGWVSPHDEERWDVELLVVGYDGDAVGRLAGFQASGIDFETALRILDGCGAISIIIDLLAASPAEYARLLAPSGGPRFLFQKQCDVRRLVQEADARIGRGRYDLLCLETALPARIVAARPRDPRGITVLTLADPNAAGLIAIRLAETAVPAEVRAATSSDRNLVIAAWFCSLGPVGAFDW